MELSITVMNAAPVYRTAQLRFLGMASRHVGEAVHHTGRPDPAALPHPAVIGVEYILHGKAGAGRAHEAAPPAGSTAGIILIPLPP